MTLQFKKPEGWGFPLNLKKAHYFVDKRSLCGKWLFLGHLDPANDDSYDNCIVCKKALLKRKSKEALNGRI